MKIKLFVAREIQYFELGIFSFIQYVYYLTRGFNLLTRAFNLPARAFTLLTRAFNLAARVLTREFELVTRGFELITRRFELVTRVLLFHLRLSVLLANKTVKQYSNSLLVSNVRFMKTLCLF